MIDTPQQFWTPEGYAVLQMPATLSATSYQDFEDWMRLVLRALKRRIPQGPPTREDMHYLTHCLKYVEVKRPVIGAGPDYADADHYDVQVALELMEPPPQDETK